MGASVVMRGVVRRLMALAGVTATAIAFSALAATLFSSSARAEYDLCNETSYVIRAAIAYRGSDDYQSAGWFTVYPGFCRPVIDKPLTEDTYFIHARTIAGHSGPMHDWAGDEKFCVALNDFDIAGSNNCEQRGYASAYFSEVEVGRAKTWTTTFTEPNTLDLPKAQILGVQRLLVDLGLMTRERMDGYLGRSTVNAIQRFKHQNSLDLPDEPSIELLRTLAQVAEDRAKGHGLQLCNGTKYAIWAAVGMPVDAMNVTTKGWFEIQPNQCVKPVLEPLAKSFVYVYGETVDAAEKKLYWQGNNRLCTNDVMFSITAKPDTCDDQGLTPAEFEKVDTQGKEYWSFTFTEEKASEKSGG